MKLLKLKELLKQLFHIHTWEFIEGRGDYDRSYYKCSKCKKIKYD